MNRVHFINATFGLALFALGCGGNSDSDYVPGAGAARQSLTLALDAWKSGQAGEAAGKLASGQTVLGIDSDWSGGKQLASYEIVSELPSEGTSPKKLSVKLTFKSGETAEATYFIVGNDPIRVFREQDYKRYFDPGN